MSLPIMLLLLCGESVAQSDGPTDTPLPVGPGIDADEVTGRLTDGMHIPVRVVSGRGYETFVINVPRRTQSMRFLLESDEADVDIYVRHGALMASYDQADASALTAYPVEQLYIEGRALQPGDWYIDVAASSGQTVDATLQVDFNVPEIPDFYEEASNALSVDAQPGVWMDGHINRAMGRYQTFIIDVPEGTESMYIQTRNAQYDIDLFLREGEPINDWGEDPDHESVTARLDESLTIRRKASETLPTGEWYLDVVTFHDSDEEIDFEIQVSFNKPPVDDTIPEGPMVPAPQEGFSVLERALWSTVKVDGEGGSGSGTMVSDEGLIITNHHVIFDDNEREISEELYISLTYAFDETPAQRLIARPLEYDEDLDLALLQVVSDMHGNPLPEGTRFHPVPLGDSENVRLGQTIWIAGYPAVGGGSSRSPISVTSGIMSGWDNPADGLSWIKTDARINAGNSGGSMFDSEGYLIAVPTMEMIDADDELGFSRPVHLLPESWLHQIANPPPIDLTPPSDVKD